MVFKSIAEYAETAIIKNKRRTGKVKTISKQYVNWCLNNERLHLLPGVTGASKVGSTWVLTIDEKNISKKVEK